MYNYLRSENFEKGHTYLTTFTSNPETWKKATPIYYLHKTMPPMLITREKKHTLLLKKQMKILLMH